MLITAGCNSSSSDGESAEITSVESVHGGGSSSSLLDIVIMGDGYTESEQDEYNEYVDKIVDDLLSMEPFHSIDCSFNIWKINLTTPEGDESVLGVQQGGADDPERFIEGNAESCLAACERAGVPGYDVIIVLVNSDTYAAWTDLTNNITYVTDRYPWGRIVAHELGHSIGGLGDEYSCRICDPNVTETLEYPVADRGEPAEPNLTATLNKTEIPWGSDISATVLPSVAAAGLDTCNARTPVGAYQGGGYYAEGIYRPEEFCLMDQWMCQSEDYCAVCLKTLSTRLQELCEGLH